MKTIQLTILGAIMVLALGLGFAAPAYAADDAANGVTYHQQKAAEYQAKIDAQDAIINEHTQMPVDYKKQFAINPKTGAPAAVEKMDAHCAAIVADAQKLKVDLLEFKKWHEMRASELQGQ